MIIMNPYVFLESHRGSIDRIFDEAVKKNGLVRQKAPVPQNHSDFVVEFLPGNPQDMENTLRSTLDKMLSQLKDKGLISAVYDELVVFPSMGKPLHYWFLFHVRYA